MQTKQTKNAKTSNKQQQQKTKKEGKREQKEEYTLQTIIKMESISLKINTYPQIPCDFEMCQGQ